MKSFSDYIKESYLYERILNVTDKSITNPSYNQMVFLAGGAGSGKGFVLANFLGIGGKVFDVDAVKQQILKYQPETIKQEFEKETGRYLDSIKLSNPEDVSLLHAFVKAHGYADKAIIRFFIGQQNNQNKPNVIFDVTLKDTDKLIKTSLMAKRLGGYDPKNIHVVWIANDFNVAVIQNQQRERSVSGKIMMQTHTGASLTMKELIDNCSKYKQYADGNYWIFFNKANVDNVVTKTTNSFIVNNYTAILLKPRGGSASLADIEKRVIQKINQYVPAGAAW